MKSIMLVDDHEMLKIGLKTYIESSSDFSVCKMVSTEEETLEYLEECTVQKNLPGVILFDIQLENQMSFSLIKKVTENYPEIKSVVYSMFNTTGYVSMAKESGVKGYVSKTADGKELLECIKKVFDGEECFEFIDIEKLNSTSKVYLVLTKTERKTFEYILMGKNNAEIARLLDVKLHTVEKYICSIYEKLGVSFREELLAKYQ